MTQKEGAAKLLFGLYLSSQIQSRKPDGLTTTITGRFKLFLVSTTKEPLFDGTRLLILQENVGDRRS
jgi:hypothetical protein